jgi:hypothetical protein
MEVQAMLIVLCSALSIWSFVLTLVYFKQQQFFARLTKGINTKDLKSVLEYLDKHLQDHKQELELIHRTIKRDQEQSKKSLQKYAMKRFNPFDETGGDQSFSLCLLNADNEGFVVTSLHSRDTTRVYAKVVSAKMKSTELSKEEQEVLAQAMKGR